MIMIMIMLNPGNWAAAWQAHMYHRRRRRRRRRRRTDSARSKHF